LLARLNENADWRYLYGRKSSRLKDLELILRFFALYFHLGSYERPMKQFLNRFMASNQELKVHSPEEFGLLFSGTVHAIRAGIGQSAFRPFGSAVNAAVMDSIMYGVARGYLRDKSTPPTLWAQRTRPSFPIPVTRLMSVSRLRARTRCERSHVQGQGRVHSRSVTSARVEIERMSGGWTPPSPAGPESAGNSRRNRTMRSMSASW